MDEIIFIFFAQRIWKTTAFAPKKQSAWFWKLNIPKATHTIGAYPKCVVDIWVITLKMFKGVPKDRIYFSPIIEA